MAVDIPIHHDETLDDLRLGGLKILQKKGGYRFSLDPVLLCAFAGFQGVERICDLGCGSGVIPLILSRTSDARRIVGVEIQEESADRARRSVLLNGVQDRVEIVRRDVRSVREVLAAESCQVVMTNPPYRRPGTGRLAPGDERARARHELHGGLDDFLACASYLLGTGGRFFMVHLAERLTDVLAGMRQAGLEPKRLRCVHSRYGESARMILVEGRRGGAPGLALEAPLFVYDKSGKGYSEEVLGFYGED
ncbi:SAM-dependent methyltransferase [Syntrophotalea carbinolica DSM 2380]|uniref:SAM-dependent methyltransferase n=1 Tax=Syntrophotalea carbinolica (strain DSM 2380 / NBRC 103641 / GraBd1) TaxID=338963 RepID=Q3A2E1_SYNC1|nr:tRNA1(Val) (adenine(37)-N6)-methyltransferase [Syntrophotalea carbinolica]ABA89466.1 SAM-dependent methyltransferase [Syntrophotalea carbinolica DSM 2380]